MCGDGISSEDEECDDGNTNNHDGCSSVCLIESGWECTGEPSTCTPEPSCGDYICNGAENCSTCAADCGACPPVCTDENTVVGGTIYNGTLANGVAGADVEVICHHGSDDYTALTTSGIGGKYSVAFQCFECSYNDLVTVNAWKDTLEGTEDGEVDMQHNLPCGVTLNVGIVDVELAIPEFGVVAAGIAVVGALGIFLYRRK